MKVMLTRVLRFLIPSRNYYAIALVMTVTTIIGALLMIIGEIESISYVSSFGGGILASGLVSLILFMAQSNNERRQNLETLYFIVSRFTEQIGFLKPLSHTSTYNSKTLEYYESLFKDLDKFEELWGKVWFSKTDQAYYHEAVYKTMCSYCEELRAYWDFRSATGAPDDAYINDIISLQTKIFDENGNNVMKAQLSKACDKLLCQINESKL